MRKTKIKILQILLVIFLNIAVIACAATGGSMVRMTLSRQGSRGEEVRQIQTKLKQWGYYRGTVDGIYGTQTVNAVKMFQKKYGLVADGIAGPKTLEKIGLNSSSGARYSQSDINLLARVISAEARGEPYLGQVAVGGVILNRMEHPSFPDTLAGIIYQPGAFTCINDGQFDKPVAESAYRAAADAFNGSDPSGGAIYYYNPAKTSNRWMLSRPVIKVIGGHKFCK